MNSPGSFTSWDLSDIRRRLEARALVIDVRTALERWHREGHTGDEQAFVDWAAALHAEEQVLVTEILPPRLAAGSVPTVSTDVTLIDPTLIRDDDATVVSNAGAPLPRAHSSMPAEGPRAASSARYVIVGEAGKGGMAVVHVARDLELMRSVALKQLAGSVAAHQGVQARFLREVQISAQLDHPNIVPVYGLEVGPDGIPAYAMKLVRGRTFAQFLKETRAFHERSEAVDEAHSLPARLEHFLKVCDAMAYAHDKGVVHRDLKPANVMLGHHNEIYVMDWGICRVIQLPDAIDTVDVVVDAEPDADSRTQMGTVVGTARYMSPEQASGRSDAIGPASDQYSLGLILFEVVTLASPYDGGSVVEVLARAARGEVRPVHHAFPGEHVPGELAAIVHKATAKDPEQRYPHVRGLAADIRRYLRGESVEARPDTGWQKAQRWVARHRQAALTSFVSLVAAASIVTGTLLVRNQRQRTFAEVRERAMLELVNHAGEQASLLQTRLLELQGEIDSLASTAALALVSTAPANERFYWVDDFSDPDRQPPDMVQVDGEPHPQSLSFGAWLPAPGADRRALTATIQRMLHLRHHRNELFQRARVLFGDAEPASSGVLAGSGIDAFVTGLAAGVTFHLPGHAGLPAVHDARQQPWYRLAAGHSDARWGEPYLAEDGRVVVPLSQAIRTADGRELGVTSVLLSLDYIARNLLADSGDTTARGAVLLDTHGRVLAAHGLPQAFTDGAFLRPFPEPELLRALSERDTGYVMTTAFGRSDVLSFSTVHSLDWSVVKVAGEAEALAAVSPQMR